MKAFILTYAGVNESEKLLLLHTGIFKLALNQHAKELNPDARIITDYTLPKIYRDFPEKIISIREKLRFETPKVEYPKIEFKGSTIIAGLEYLIKNCFNEILIIGDNSVNSIAFQNEVNIEIDKIKDSARIYQYRNGNFHLPVRSIENFIIN